MLGQTIDDLCGILQCHTLETPCIGNTVLGFQSSLTIADWAAFRRFAITPCLPMTPEFGRRFWDFISAGGYENREKSNNAPQFYRFDRPKDPDYPHMIELFSRSDSVFDDDKYDCRPLHLGDELSSLLAILLNNDYYRLLLVGREAISDVTILPEIYLLLFKAKAWIDLTARKASGQSIDEKDIRKHKNDVARLAALLSGNENCTVPGGSLLLAYFILSGVYQNGLLFRDLLHGVRKIDGFPVLDILYTML